MRTSLILSCILLVFSCNKERKNLTPVTQDRVGNSKETKPDAKPEVNTEIKPEVKSEVNTETKPDEKPANKLNNVNNENDEDEESPELADQEQQSSIDFVKSLNLHKESLKLEFIEKFGIDINKFKKYEDIYNLNNYEIIKGKKTKYMSLHNIEKDLFSFRKGFESLFANIETKFIDLQLFKIKNLFLAQMLTNGPTVINPKILGFLKTAASDKNNKYTSKVKKCLDFIHNAYFLFEKSSLYHDSNGTIQEIYLKALKKANSQEEVEKLKISKSFNENLAEKAKESCSL